MGYLSSFLKSYYQDDKPQQPSQATPVVSATPPSYPQPNSSIAKDAPVTAVKSVSASASPISGTRSAVASSLDPDGLYQNPRARTIKQLSVYFAGVGFMAASIYVTRRAVARKLAVTTPRFYTRSNHKAADANGAVEAAEAFALATINVGAFALMMTGGAMYAFDVVNAEDLRAKYKRHMGFNDNFEQTPDEDIEEWVKSVLDKKDGGDYKGVAEGLTALVGVLAGKEEDKEKLKKMTQDMESAKSGSSRDLTDALKDPATGDIPSANLE